MEPGREGNTNGRKTMNAIVTAQGWFNLGERVPYDRRARKMLRLDDTTDSPDVVHVFQRVVRDGAPGEEAVWTTFLPGFPDGSFGWARVDRYVSGLVPKIFVEYVGQGDSDAQNTHGENGHVGGPALKGCVQPDGQRVVVEGIQRDIRGASGILRSDQSA